MPSLDANDLQRLLRLVNQTSLSHREVLSRALDHYERAYLLEAMNAGFDALRTDPAAWAEEERERALWDSMNAETSVHG